MMDDNKCPECNMPSDSKGFPHYAHCSKASNEQKWPTDACERVKVLEDALEKIGASRLHPQADAGPLQAIARKALKTEED